MERFRPLIWEPGGTGANTTAGTARHYRKPLHCLLCADCNTLLLDTIDRFYDRNVPRLGASVAFLPSHLSSS
ncbi:MAG: hypothetical protein JST93_23120 [Acidobacteria bacterium]|nr:hypothetical protein [Acidobacteriota bacterium]